jgi:hypothetical protein
VCELDLTSDAELDLLPEEPTPFFGEDEEEDASPETGSVGIAKTCPEPDQLGQPICGAVPPPQKPCATAQISWDLPLVLAEYGPVAKQLEATTWLDNPEPWESHLIAAPENVIKQWPRIRTSIKYGLRLINGQYKMQRYGSEERSPEQFLGDINDFLINCDPVLSCCVLHALTTRKPCDGLFDNAKTSYTAFTEVYDLILGDAVPPALREACASQLASRRFNDGSHATALQDWDVCRHGITKTKGGLTTGLPTVDRMLGGGFSDVTVIGADEGDGKTSFALRAVTAAMRANEDLGCLFLALDEPKQDIFKKLFSFITEVDFATIELPDDQRSEEDNARIKRGEAELTSSPKTSIGMLPRG